MSRHFRPTYCRPPERWEGAGWRSGALHIVILATDVCSISAFPAGGPIPGMITGTGASMEPVSAFACSSTTPGVSRFGFVSNSKTLAGNIVAGAVAPSESATVQATVTALNALGIRVLGMGPGATGPTASPGPSFSPSVLLSALARLTGAVDGGGTPLVFSIGAGGAALSAAIVAAILTTVTAPVDITLANSALPAGLSLSFTPSQVDDVVPGEMASFSLVLTGDGTPINGTFDLNFVDVNGETVLGTIPVTVECPTGNAAPVCTAAAAGPSQLWPPNHKLVPINISGVTDPDGDTVTIVATSVTQDEPLTGRGRGAGNTSPDASIDASGAVAVRSERNGNPRTPGDGRVYHISFTATDPSGAACSGIVDVCVPHDQGNGNFCVDGGPLFSSIP